MYGYKKPLVYFDSYKLFGMPIDSTFFNVKPRKIDLIPLRVAKMRAVGAYTLQRTRIPY